MRYSMARRWPFQNHAIAGTTAADATLLLASRRPAEQDASADPARPGKTKEGGKCLSPADQGQSSTWSPSEYSTRIAKIKGVTEEEKTTTGVKRLYQIGGRRGSSPSRHSNVKRFRSPSPIRTKLFRAAPRILGDAIKRAHRLCGDDPPAKVEVGVRLRRCGQRFGAGIWVWRTVFGAGVRSPMMIPDIGRRYRAIDGRLPGSTHGLCRGGQGRHIFVSRRTWPIFICS